MRKLWAIVRGMFHQLTHPSHIVRYYDNCLACDCRGGINWFFKKDGGI